MKVCAAWVFSALTFVLLVGHCYPQEEMIKTPDDADVEEQKPLAVEPLKKQNQFQDLDGDANAGKITEKTEDGVTAEADNSNSQTENHKDSGQSQETSDPMKEKEEEQPELSGEGVRKKTAEETNADAGHDRDSETVKPEKKETKPVRMVLEAFGAIAEEGDKDTQKNQDTEQQEGDAWTEQTEEGTEQKRTGGRRFFSLMNLIKFLLNPVIEEFQEVEKSTSAGDAAGTSTTTTTTNAINNSNHSGVAGVTAGNSSEANEKETEKKNGTESGKKTKFQCVGKNVTENTTALVRVINSTILLELLSFDKNHSTSDCVLVLFYAPWCHFCAATAPHYNAVARAFPQLEVLAVDTVHFSNLNARFGTVAVPNIMLFHQSRSAVRFNHTERHFQTLLQFVRNTTGMEANSSVELSPEDYMGPLSSTPTEETDYLLWFAWVFIIACSGHIFVSSRAGQLAIERVNVLWQEHQHQHME